MSNTPSYLDISLSLIRHLHDELGLRVDHVLKDLVIDTGTTNVGIWLKDVTRYYSHCAKVIRVRDKQVLLALGNKLVENAGMKERIVQVTVAGRVPVLLVVFRRAGAREEGLLVDTRVARLVEGRDAQLLVRILLDDAQRILMSVE